MKNKDIQIQSPIDGREMNLKFIGQFYEKVEVESENDKKMFSLIKFWYDTTANNAGFHQIYITYVGDESKEIIAVAGFNFNPTERLNMEFLKNISKNTPLYLN